MTTPSLNLSTLNTDINEKWDPHIKSSEQDTFKYKNKLNTKCSIFKVNNFVNIQVLTPEKIVRISSKPIFKNIFSYSNIRKTRWFAISLAIKKIELDFDFHRVCNAQSVYTCLDEIRSKILQYTLSVLILPFSYSITVFYSILANVNGFFGFLRFFVHLFIKIINLLFIYSLLSMFLLVFIFYYFVLFFEEKNEVVRAWLSPYFVLEKPLFLKNIRRCLYDYMNFLECLNYYLKALEVFYYEK